MPVIPSFSGFAATPNLAQSFLGGARISADIASEAQRIQLQHQQLQQSAQLAQMEMQAKSAQAERQALREQQEMEMEKAYKEAQIGLRQRELQGEEQVLQFKVKQVAQKAAAQQSYQASAQKLIDTGMNPQEAYQQAALQFGPQMDLPSGAYSAAFRGSRSGADFGGASDVAGLPENYKQVQTGPGTRRILRVPDTITGTETATPIPGAKGYVEYRGKTLHVADETKPIQKQLDALQKTQEGDTPGIGAFNASKEGKRLTDPQKIFLKKYNDRQQQIDDLKDEIKALRAGAKVPSQSKTNRIGRFKIITDQP